MKAFEFYDDLTSDALFKAYGKTYDELFENAGRALFSLICDTSKVPDRYSVAIKLEGDNIEGLLYDWLSQLLAESEINALFFSNFRVTITEGNKLDAVAYGSRASPRLGKVQVKAITKYKFSLEKTDEGFSATVSCDI